jgi:hypothetical protein
MATVLLYHCPKYVTLETRSLVEWGQDGARLNCPCRERLNSDCHPIPVFLQSNDVRRLQQER